MGAHDDAPNDTIPVEALPSAIAMLPKKEAGLHPEAIAADKLENLVMKDVNKEGGGEIKLPGGDWAELPPVPKAKEDIKQAKANKEKAQAKLAELEREANRTKEQIQAAERKAAQARRLAEVAEE